MDKTLSIVLPSYNEEQMIEKTTETISDIMERERIPYELIFVNDGSKDGTWDKILEQKEKNTHVKGVCFSRNFEKNRPFLPDLIRQQVHVSQLWTVICSILRRRW